MRFYQIYGPNQSINRLIPIVIKSCIKDKKFNCSSGIQKRDFNYALRFYKFDKIIKSYRKKIKGIYNGSGTYKC